ncbi:hypothetical protein [Shewanella frigidimarina]|uniref:hypothetical protein n=1 Tax=Shewanella frigidimarina TaxID=56812 RepID=UPI000F509CE9|nr:hypothetical protein [Shewanella frigidimarina]
MAKLTMPLHRVFRQFGFDNEEEKKNGALKENGIASSEFVAQMLNQINAGTHALTDDGMLVKIGSV